MTGVPMTREEMAKDPNDERSNIVPYVNKGDIFAESVGYEIGGDYGFSKDLARGGPELGKAADLHDFQKSYVMQLSNDDLWGEGGDALGPDALDRRFPNDEPDDATELGNADPAYDLYASMLSLNLEINSEEKDTIDHDWFTFTVDEGVMGSDSLIWISFSTIAADLDLYVAKGLENAKRSRWVVQSNATDTPYEAVSLAGLGPGTYYFHIYSDTNLASKYRLSYQLRPEYARDRSEPNNYPIDATFLGVGGKQNSDLSVNWRRNLHNSLDEDWYYFRIQEAVAPQSSVAISLDNDQGNLDLQFFAETPGGTLKSLARSQSTDDVEYIDLSALDLGPGYYYIRVHRAAPEVINGYDLTLTLPAPESLPPVFTKGAKRPSTSVSEGDLIYIDFPAKDPNGDIIDYTLGPNAPAGMEINGHSGTVRYASQIGDGDRYFDISVIATDTKGKSSKSKMRVYVDAAKPTIDEVRTETLSITNAGIDPVTILASGVYFPVKNGDVTFTLDTNQDGQLSAGDMRLGTGKMIASGLYRWDGRIRGNLAPGTYKIFAQGTRDVFDGTLKSNPVSTPIEITAAPPPVQLAFPDGGDQRVNAEGIGDLRHGLITRDDAGNRYVFFTATANNQLSLLMQKFDPQGAPLGVAVPLNVGDAGVNDVDMRGNGEFVITNIGSIDFRQYVNTRRFDADGNPLSDLLSIPVTNVGSDGARSHSRVGIDEQGNFVVVWAQGNYTEEDLYFSRYNSANELLDVVPRLVHPPTSHGQRDPDIAMSPNGDFVIVWLDVVDHDVLGRRFSNGGHAGPVFSISVDSVSGFGDFRDIAVDTTPSGGFLAAWRGELNNEHAVLIRQFHANQTPLTDKELRVDNFSDSFIDDLLLSVGPTGHAAVSYVVLGYDSNDGQFDKGTYGQLIGPQGEKLGDSFKIPDFDQGNQFAAGISVDSDADIFATWLGDVPSGGGGGPGGPGGEGDTNAIFFRKFSVNIAPDTSSRLEGLTGSSQRTFAPTNPDPDGDNLVVTKIGDQNIQSGQTVTLPSGGKVRLESSGQLTYIPPRDPGFGSRETFSYTVADGHGGESQSVAMFVITSPLAVRRIQPALDEGTLLAGVSRLQVEFNQPVNTDVDAADVELRSSGPDKVFGNNDDVLIPVTPLVTGSGVSLAFPSLSPGDFRLTLKDTIHDTDDKKLDGDADRTAGGNLVREFHVGQVATESLVSFTGIPVTVGTSADNMGQIIGGPGGVYDGLNKLQIESTDYAPLQGLLSVDLPADNLLAADGNYHELGLRTSFVASGGPVRVDLQLELRNEATLGNQLAFRFVLDGAPLTEYVTDLEAGSTQPWNLPIHLEEFLEVVNSGTHVITVEARSVGTMLEGAGIIATKGARLNVWQSAPFDNGDPSVVFASRRLTADVEIVGAYEYRELIQNTFDSNGGPARISVPLQVFNQTGLKQSVEFLLLIDGVQVAWSFVDFAGEGRSEGAALLLTEGTIPELPAGNHNISLKVRPSNFAGSMRLGAGSAINILQPQPIPGVDSSTLVQSAATFRNAPSVTDGDFHPLDLTLPFRFDGDPVRLALPLGVINLSSEPQQVTVRLTVDGDPLRESTVQLFGATTEGVQQMVHLEEFLVDLTVGEHTVGVELKTSRPIEDPTLIQYHPTTLTAQRLTKTPVVTNSVDGQSIVTPVQNVNGIELNREVTISATGGAEFVRTVETLVNPTPTAATLSVQLASNLGSDERTIVFATSDGDTTVEATDWWVGMDDEDGTGTPAVIHILRSPYTPPAQSLEVHGDAISWKLSIQVPGNSTRRVATFNVTADQREDVLHAIEALVQTTQLGEPAVEGLMSDEIQSLANFTFPTVPTQLELSNVTVTERVSGAIIGKAKIVDPVAGQSYVFAANDPRFELVQDELRLRDSSFLRVAYDSTLSIEIVVTNTATPPQQITAWFDFQVIANEKPWQNGTKPLDASDDGVVAPNDALLLINLLNDANSSVLEPNGALPEARPLATTLAFFDANGDGFCAPNDVLQIINFLNGEGGEAERGEEPIAGFARSEEPVSPATVDAYFAEFKWLNSSEDAEVRKVAGQLEKDIATFPAKVDSELADIRKNLMEGPWKANVSVVVFTNRLTRAGKFQIWRRGDREFTDGSLKTTSLKESLMSSGACLDFVRVFPVLGCE